MRQKGLYESIVAPARLRENATKFASLEARPSFRTASRAIFFTPEAAAYQPNESPALPVSAR